MKKKVLGVIAVVAVAAIAGYNVYFAEWCEVVWLGVEQCGSFS